MTEDKKWVIVRDEFSLPEGDEGYWFAHTRANIELVNGGRVAILEESGEKLYVAVLGDGKFEIKPAMHICGGNRFPDQFDNSQFRKLLLRFNGEGSVAVAITPVENGIVPTELPQDKPIVEW